jgi:hypothetical protein
VLVIFRWLVEAACRCREGYWTLTLVFFVFCLDFFYLHGAGFFYVMYSIYVHLFSVGLSLFARRLYYMERHYKSTPLDEMAEANMCNSNLIRVMIDALNRFQRW